MEKQFWFWLSTWAVFLQRPSDLGYDDTGYDLPKMRVSWHKVDVDHTKAWQQRGVPVIFAGSIEAAARIAFAALAQPVRSADKALRSVRWQAKRKGNETSPSVDATGKRMTP
jgi:hypothetical protein